MRVSIPTAVGLLWSLGVPAMWVLGVEQLAWWLCTTALLAIVLVRRPLHLSHGPRLVAYYWVLFLFAIVLAGVQVSESRRIISFARDLSVYASCLSVFLLVATARTAGSRATLLWHLTFFFLVTGLTSLTYVVIGSWSIESIFGQLVPSWLADTTTGSRIIRKTVAAPLSFFGIIGVRVRGFFFSSIQYGGVILLVLPVLAWSMRHNPRGRLMSKLAFFVGLICLFYTQSRTALAMLLLLPIIHHASGALIEAKGFLSRRLVILMGELLVSTAIIGAALGPLIMETFEAVFVLERAGSFSARMGVYQATFAGIMERPLLGWGTQRDIPGLLFPAGSHNWPLGIIYKYGLLGTFPWAIMILLALRGVFRTPDPVFERQEDQAFRRAIGTGILAYLVVTLTLEPINDAIAIHTFAALLGLAVGDVETRRPTNRPLGPHDVGDVPVPEPVTG
jgi:polysaccharide biosynthesis protein PslJ